MVNRRTFCNSALEQHLLNTQNKRAATIQEEVSPQESSQELGGGQEKERGELKSGTLCFYLVTKFELSV